ncbi:Trehalose monomycolate exporter MmpL3 [Dissostichus eleginoides]|uniref:Trehalose monomycolate exporter MmpL3 n=1 Tax=Dissostichus eleginoides TaxID=100907 RepID=A0AAD9BA32_DISEL|nr:Trehalose monomycolate exporter MmpL3 [Dissostichus eleginoides]
MENTKMMVLSACLIFMILGCTQVRDSLMDLTISEGCDGQRWPNSSASLIVDTVWKGNSWGVCHAITYHDGCIQAQFAEQSVANTTVTSNNTTPLLGHTSGPVISNNLSAPITTGLPPPTTTTTTPITSSRQPTKSSGASSPAHTCHHHSSAATSASFFGPCSQVLVTVLIGGSHLFSNMKYLVLGLFSLTLLGFIQTTKNGQNHIFMSVSLIFASFLLHTLWQ